MMLPTFIMVNNVLGKPERPLLITFFFEFLALNMSMSVLPSRENPGKQKVHLCTVRVHPETERTKGPNRYQHNKC